MKGHCCIDVKTCMMWNNLFLSLSLHISLPLPLPVYVTLSV